MLSSTGPSDRRGNSHEYNLSHSVEVRRMSASPQRSTSEMDNGPTLGETRERLQGALQQSRETPNSNEETSGEDSTTTPSEIIALVERAAPGIAALREWLQGDASMDESQEAIDDLRVVIDEATDLLETVDIAALPDVVEIDELPSAIDEEKIPEALSGGKLTDPVDFARLNELIDYGKLLQVVDFRALITQKTAFDDALSKIISENESESETTDEDSDTDRSPGAALNTAYETAHEKSTSLDEKIGTSGKRSSVTSAPFSTVPSQRPDIGTTSHFSTVPSR